MFKSRKKSACSAAGRTVQARRYAVEEGLTLLVADNKTGYFGVTLDKKCQANSAKPFEAQVSRGGKKECLGHFGCLVVTFHVPRRRLLEEEVVRD